MTSTQIFIILGLVITIQCFPSLGPHVNVQLLQSIAANYTLTGSTTYWEESNICVKFDLLGIPSSGDYALKVYKFNPTTSLYELHQVLNSTFHSAFAPPNYPRSCAISISYDMYVGFSSYSNNIGIAYNYIYDTLKFVTAGISTLNSPNPSSKYLFGYRIYDIGNDYYLFSAPLAPVPSFPTQKGSLLLVKYTAGIQQIVIQNLDTIGFGYGYYLTPGVGTPNIFALYGGTSYEMTQFNNYAISDSGYTAQTSLNIYPYAVYPDGTGLPVKFRGITMLNSTTIAVRLDGIYSNQTIFDQYFNDQIGQIDILTYKSGSWKNITSLYEEPPNSFSSSYYYNYGHRLTSNQSVLIYVTGANELKFAQLDGNNKLKLLKTYNAAETIGSNNANPKAFPIIVKDDKLFIGTQSGVSIYTVNFTCDAGYRLNSNLYCDEIDECAEGTHQCSSLRKCVNTAGGYSCTTCPSGYRDNGLYNCDDINECVEKTALCVNRTCINTNGSYICDNDCPTGYTVSGNYTCVDLDECSASSTNNCSKSPVRQCQNTPGGYTCGDCPTPYVNSGPYQCIAGTNPIPTSASAVGSSNNQGSSLTQTKQITTGTVSTSQKGNGLTLFSIMLTYFIVVLL